MASVRSQHPSKIVYSITYALPGQVGFCVPSIAEDPEYVQRLQALLFANRWVMSEQVNSVAGSIVITYKSGVIPDHEMRSHFASLIQSASDAVVATDLMTASTQLPTQDAASLGSHPQPATHFDETNQLATPISRIDYSIAHAIPGRVRFHVPRIAKDPKYVQRLQSLLEAEPWITSQRVNSAAASIAITYKSGVISDAQTRLRSMGEAQSHLATLIQSASDTVVATGYER